MRVLLLTHPRPYAGGVLQERHKMAELLTPKEAAACLLRPAYVSRTTLARLLDCAESTVDEFVKRGVLPKPIHLSKGCVRGCWDDVVLALASLREGTSATETDPYFAGAKNVTEIAARSR